MTISRRRAQLVLWLALLFTVPVPYYLGGFEVAPVVRLLFLATLVSGVLLTEGASGMQGPLGALAVGLALLWTALLYGASALLVRPAARPTGTVSVPLVAGATLALLALSLLPLYRTSLSSVSAVSNLLGLFD